MDGGGMEQASPAALGTVGSLLLHQLTNQPKS